MISAAMYTSARTRGTAEDRARRCTQLEVNRQLVLIDGAPLRRHRDPPALRHQRVREVGAVFRQVRVRERELVLSRTQVRDVSANPQPHGGLTAPGRLQIGERRRGELQRQRAAVEHERHLAQHASGVGGLFDRRQRSIAVAVDRGEQGIGAGRAGCQGQIDGDMVRLHRDPRRLQVPVAAMRRHARAERQRQGQRDERGADATCPHRPIHSRSSDRGRSCGCGRRCAAARTRSPASAPGCGSRRRCPRWSGRSRRTRSAGGWP